jgi:Tol biopolymer transport system component
LLVGDSPIVCRFPSWLYSQRSIMFVEPLTHYIIKYNLTTSDLDTVMSDVYLRCFDLAGNDSTMVYEHDSRIWIRQGNGLAPVCLFNRWGRDPSISRDGQRVLFVGSDSESQYDAIWIASTDGTWVTQLTSASDWLGP